MKKSHTFFKPEDGKGVPAVFNGGVVLQLDMAFALQLQEIFGPVGYDVNSEMLVGKDLEVNVNLDLAKEIYTAFTRGLTPTSGGEDEVDAGTLRAEARKSLEENGKGVPTAFHKGLELQLQVQFVLQLQQFLQSETGSRAETTDEDLTVSLDLKLVKQIHQAWSRSFEENFEEEGLLNMVMKDEALARRLQDSEDEQYVMEEHMTAGLPILDGRCLCGNRDVDRFWEIQSYSDETFLGVCCKKKKCQREYFVERICHEEEDSKNPYMIKWRGVQLLKKNPLRPIYNEGFQASLDRTPIKKIMSLKEGDHIMWSRKYLIWHHAIVTKVRKESFDVVNWTKEEGKMKIKEETFSEEDLQRAFRVNYPNVYTGKNEDRNRMIAVARAYSRLHRKGEKGKVFKFFKTFSRYNTDYTLFNANCEHLASYCVLGSGICHQSLWAEMTASSTVKRNLGKSAAMAVAEGIENLAKAPEFVGASGLILIEGLSLTDSWWTMRKLFKEGKITRAVFMQEFGKRLGGFFLGGGLGAFVGAALWFCPPLEVIFAPCAALFGKFCGEQLGFEMAFFLTENLMERDEKFVRSTEELKMGDHVVKTENGPKTHGVFVEVGSTEEHVIAIMFHEKGVELEEITLAGLKKIIYIDGENLADGATVVAKAHQFIEDPDFRPMNREQQVNWCKIENPDHKTPSGREVTAATSGQTSQFAMA